MEDKWMMQDGPEDWEEEHSEDEKTWRKGMLDIYLNGINLDEDPNNADWTKRTWDLPCNDIESLRKFLKGMGMSAEHFKKLPVYRFNVDKLPWLREL